MTANLCCNAPVRSDSPDSLNARHPVDPVYKLPLSVQPSLGRNADSLLTSSNSHELRPLYPRSVNDNILPDPRALSHEQSPENSTPRHTKSSPKFMRFIKRRLSRQSVQIQRSLGELQQEEGVEFDWLEDRSPSQGGYDADARLLPNPSVLCLWDNTSRGLREGSGQQCNVTSNGISSARSQTSPSAESPDSQSSSLKPLRSWESTENGSSSNTVPTRDSLETSTTRSLPKGLTPPTRIPELDQPICKEDIHNRPSQPLLRNDEATTDGLVTGDILENIDLHLETHGSGVLGFDPTAASWYHQQLGQQPRHPGIPESVLSYNLHIERAQLEVAEIPIIVNAFNAPAQPSTNSRVLAPESMFTSVDSPVHLYDMRISQHLRSLSSLSNDPAVASQTRPGLARLLSDASSVPSRGEIRLLHRKSSSGFKSIKVPPTWGTVIGDNTNTKALNAESRFHHRSPRMLHTEDTPDSISDKGQALESSSNYMDVIPFTHGLSEVNPDYLQPRPYKTRELAAASTVDMSDAQTWRNEVEGTINHFTSQEPSFSSSMKPSVIVDKADHRQYDMLDGPADQYLALPNTKISRSAVSPRKDSVTGNYDEVASVWAKAIQTHQEQQLAPRKSRGSSFLSAAGSVERPSGTLSDVPNDPQLNTIDDRTMRRSLVSTNIQFKPVHAEHSFNLLAVPGRESFSYAHAADSRLESLEDCTTHGSIAGLQQKAPTNEPTTASLDRIGLLNAHEQSTVPEITLTGPQRHSGEVSGPAQKASRTSLKAWPRFPSHTRAERNASAGIADKVVARDFVPKLMTEDDEADNEDNVNDSDNGKKKKQKRKVKVKTLIWRAKQLRTWPSRFVSRNSGFTQRESGHRTSIAIGGRLEYPELELLPGAESQLASPTWNEFSPLSPSANRTFSMSTNGRRSSAENHMHQDLRSMVGSSVYGSLGSPAPSDVGSTRRTGRGGWTNFHDPYSVGPRRQDTELISPLDGMLNPSNLREIPASSVMSLPSTFFETGYERSRIGKLKTASAEQLRRSTQDLREMLEQGERDDVSRALKATEDAWKDSN